KHQINDTHQVQSSYFPPNCAVASWSTQGENGVLSTSGYNHDQQVDPNLKNGQDGTNLVSNGSTSNPGPANVVQGYSGYAAYPNSDPYGYSSTGYAAYYNHYQQQPSQYQQQPVSTNSNPVSTNSNPSAAGQYQQQPGQYQQQPGQYQQQPSQYQQQSSQYQPQSNQSYPHHVGAYQNTGAPYQPLSSFQNTGSYAGPASYSSTYYNPGDYQTSGSYTSGNYGTQTNLWHGGQYATYGSHQYPNYTPDSTSAYSSTTAVATSQYQQQYKQWEDYYNQTQTEVSCAPGTENVSVSIASSVNNSVPSGSSGYTASNNQMPAAYTPSWRPEFSSSDLTSVQPGMFPKSLRGYVERALARCKNDRQKTACQAVLKEVITKATADGTLYTKDWDTEPLFPLPNTDAFNKDDTQLPIPTSVMPKSKSPSRRAKSRWEPIPEEKVVDKSANISYGTAKYGGWNSKQVRPEEVLEKALLMVQTSQKNYLYKCDQLKSIRQDLTVQRIRNELTVKCQSQLQTLYGEGITGCHMEFAAYNLLCVMLHSNNNRDLLSAMSRLSANAKKDKAVKHALSVRSAVTSGNYVTFFRLYKTAPNLNTFLMDLYVEKMRYAAVKCMSRSYRPTVPVSYLSQILGFTNALPTSESSDEKEVDGVEECIEWLKAHGACLISDSTGETLLDAKGNMPPQMWSNFYDIIYDNATLNLGGGGGFGGVDQWWITLLCHPSFA
ncbi:UNVERIFIED_CONTAM: SAC3 family protein A, partial [Sesamum latifolium]